jgi:hypothetical protein
MSSSIAALRWADIRIKSTLQAEVAQLVEQLIRNQQVVGSTPIFGSIPLQEKKSYRSMWASAWRLRSIPFCLLTP